MNLRTRLQDGQRIPTLELLDWLEAPNADLFDEREEAKAASVDDCRVIGGSLKIEPLKASVIGEIGTRPR